MENIELYNLVLHTFKLLKQEAFDASGNQLMLTGTVPEKYQNLLRKINSATGNIFDILLSDNYEYTQEDDIIKIHIKGDEFICPKEQIEFFNHTGLENITPIPSTKTPAAVISVPAEEKVPISQDISETSFIQEELPVTEMAPEKEIREDTPLMEAGITDTEIFSDMGKTGASEEKSEGNNIPEKKDITSGNIEEELLTDIFNMDEMEGSDKGNALFPIDIDTDLPADDITFMPKNPEESLTDFNTFMQLSRNDAFADDAPSDGISINDTPTDNIFMEENIQEETVQGKNIAENAQEAAGEHFTENTGMQDFTNLLAEAQVLPDTTDTEESSIPDDTEFTVSKLDTSNAGLNLNEKVLAKYTKNKDEFVFISYKIRVMTPGLGNMKEMTVMIAPLAIPEGACPSAPIITSIVCDGRISTKSSYEMEENGKNMLVIRVNNDYEFLVRGFFSGSGTFGGFVATTGKSAERGDKIEVLEENFYGKADINTPPAFTMHYNEAYDPAQAYIFPLINDKKNNFIFFEKTSEFTEYMYYTEDSLGLQKIMITDNGIRKEIVCKWEGNEAVIKVLEVQHEEF